LIRNLSHHVFDRESAMAKILLCANWRVECGKAPPPPR